MSPRLSPAPFRRRAYGPLAGLLAVSLFLSLVWACASEPPLPPPPETRVEEVVDVLHGVEVHDPYRWLEDQESPETRAWVEAQNAYTDRVLGELPYGDELEKRFEELMRVDVLTTPVQAGERYFFSQRKADQDLYVLYLRQGADGEDEVLLDPHPASEDHTVSYDLLDVDPTGHLLAYGVRQGGEDELTVKFFDVDARGDLADVLPRGRYYSVSITPEGGKAYYVQQTEEGPRLFAHALGSEVSADTVLFGDGYGPEKILYAGLSEDGRYLMVHVIHGSAADDVDVYLDDLSNPAGFTTVVDDVDARFFGSVAGGTLYLQTNWQAPNGRVLAVDPAQPERSAWREVVPERETSVIEQVSAVAGRLFVSYLEDVHSRVEAFAPDGAELGEIAFDTLGSVGQLNGLWDSEEVFFQFSSFHVPTTIYRLDVPSSEQEVWAQAEVPLATDGFVVKQEWFTSKDGTRVPMFLVHGKDLELDGSNPTLLTGYGGFTASLTPRFSAQAAAWVEHGGVYGVVNLRGGGEFGEAWHKAGMLANKQNVFDDLYAAARWLIDNGYTRPEKLAAYGSSNGGLLMGAAMTQEPDLFAALICSYPLLDMVRYPQFLVARYWVPEYGDPEDPEQFEVLRAYSPYHNVEPGTRYPAVLFITGDGDTRVAPLHARKMAALLQAANGGDNPVLLRYHTKAGHSGGQPLSERIANAAESFSFLFWQLGIGG